MALSARRRPGLADLEQQFSLARELQDVRVLRLRRCARFRVRPLRVPVWFCGGRRRPGGTTRASGRGISEPGSGRPGRGRSRPLPLRVDGRYRPATPASRTPRRARPNGSPDCPPDRTRAPAAPARSTRRRFAASWRRQFGPRGHRIEAAMHDPDVILRIDGDAGDRSEKPVIRKRLGPERIDLERGRRRRRWQRARRTRWRTRLTGSHLRIPLGRAPVYYRSEMGQ